MAKKRANGEGNIRKRADGRWEGRYTAGYHPETGKRIIKNAQINIFLLCIQGQLLYFSFSYKKCRIRFSTTLNKTVHYYSTCCIRKLL